jgi:SAM-dependent methyltransferase
MYGELFERVPDHPRLKTRGSKDINTQKNQNKLKLVEKFINKQSIFVEFGPGDCRFAMEVCKRVRSVYGIDISDQREQLSNAPDNFELIIYDGYNLEMQENSVDVIFSDQLIEHLHPEDIEFHFQLIAKILKSGGVYIFRTPHRYSGPHDVSRYFSNVAEGFHLKEWTYREIAGILSKCRFSSWEGYWYAKKILKKIPFLYFIIIEDALNPLLKHFRHNASKYLLPDITMAAFK